MKKNTILAAMLLSSTILGTVAASAAEVQPDPVNGDFELVTNAHVRFKMEEEDEDKDPEKPVVPGEPGEGGETIDPTEPGEGGGETPGGETPETTGPLALLFAPHFEFGEHVLSTNALSVPAFNQIVGSEGTNVPHFVQVKDARGYHTGWNLTVNATALTSDEGNVINDAVIKFATSNHLTTDGNGTPSFMAKQIELGKEGEQPIMTADAKSGEGVHSLQWGTAESVTEKNDDDQLLNTDVTLNISAKVYYQKRNLN